MDSASVNKAAKGTGPFIDDAPTNTQSTPQSSTPSMKGPVPVGDQATEANRPAPRALSIRNWSTVHENGHSRRRKGPLSAVFLPTAQDGNRYRRLTRLDRGLEIHGVWCLLVSIAARCPTRGLLVDELGEPMTCEDFEGMTGFPAEIFEFAISVLLDPKMGWLEYVPLNPATEEPKQIIAPTNAVRTPSNSKRSSPNFKASASADPPLATRSRTPDSRTPDSSTSDSNAPDSDVVTPEMIRRFKAFRCAKEHSQDVLIRSQTYDDPDFTQEAVERIWNQIQNNPEIPDKVEEFNRRIHEFPN